MSPAKLVGSMVGFFNRGRTIARFWLAGMTPFDSEELHSEQRMGTKTCFNFLIIHVGKLVDRVNNTWRERQPRGR